MRDDLGEYGDIYAQEEDMGRDAQPGKPEEHGEEVEDDPVHNDIICQRRVNQFLECRHLPIEVRLEQVEEDAEAYPGEFSRGELPSREGDDENHLRDVANVLRGG